MNGNRPAFPKPTFFWKCYIYVHVHIYVQYLRALFRIEELLSIVFTNPSLLTLVETRGAAMVFAVQWIGMGNSPMFQWPSHPIHIQPFSLCRRGMASTTGRRMELGKCIFSIGFPSVVGRGAKRAMRRARVERAGPPAQCVQCWAKKQAFLTS